MSDHRIKTEFDSHTNKEECIAIKRLAKEIGELLGRFLEKETASGIPASEPSIPSTVRNESARPKPLT